MKKEIKKEDSTADTLPKLLLRNQQIWGDKVAWRKKRFGIWQEYTWNEIFEKVKVISLGLMSIGFEVGDRVCILGDNNPEWFMAEMAVVGARGIVIGLYPDSQPSEVKYYVEHSESKFVVAQDQEQVDKLLKVKGDLPSLKKVVYWDERGMRHYNDPILMTWGELTRLGKDCERSHPKLFEDNIALGKGSDPHMIVYTSGTTGVPKGALTNHERGLAMALRMQALNPIYGTDDYVTTSLPGWGVEQGQGLIPSLLWGVKLNFPEEPETIAEDLREVSPQQLLYPPRVWEQLASSMIFNIEESNVAKRGIYKLCLPVGYKAADLSISRGRTGLFWRALRALAELLVFRPLRDRHGYARVRLPWTAGAMLSPDTVRFFRAIGLNIRQIYGTTETGSLTVHTDDDFKFESVGKPILDRLVRIGNDGEILSDMEGISLGYYRNQEATEKLFRGGWCHTGDAGYLDEEGHLQYIDRVEDMKQLADGTRFSPQYIESRLKFSPYIRDVLCVAGGKRESIGAVVNIDFDHVGHWAEKKKIAYTTYADLSQKAEVLQVIRGEIERINTTLPPDTRIKRFVNLHKEFDPDEEELTRSRKLRRKFMEDRYQDLLEMIYGNREEVVVEAPVVYRDGRRATVATKIKVVRLE
jgi:long-chain acyl-CoA synthetase